jgi:glucokinase
VILAGDVGGTKTQLALYEPGGSPRSPVLKNRLPSRDYPSLEALVGVFLDGAKMRPTRAVLGIAGPVVDNRCEATNLPWQMSGAEIGAAIGGARVTLLNDLVTTAWGLDEVAPGDLVTLQAGVPLRGNRALIAAGTGLGEVIVVRDGERWIASASEGGHADFGSRTPVEDELLVWMRARHGRVSYERILSGAGLADLHRFMRDTKRGEEPAEVAREFDQAPDPAAVVTQSALEGRCERAKLALELFCDIYGAEAGNLALKALAVGGFFVGGGIAPKIQEVIASGRFVRAFNDKGRLKPLLDRVPIALIRDENTSLWGAARLALMSST